MTNDLFPKDQDNHFSRNNNFLIRRARKNDEQDRASVEYHEYDFAEVTGKEYPIDYGERILTHIIEQDTSKIDNVIEYCVSIIVKEARNEERLVKQLMYTMLSAYTNNPFNLGINSPSGEGKNWVLRKVAEKFPREDIVPV